MNEYRKIQSETLGTYIGYYDTVSGAFFHKFVKEYHAYDRRQKEQIAQLQQENEQLREERDSYAKNETGICTLSLRSQATRATRSEGMSRTKSKDKSLQFPN